MTLDDEFFALVSSIEVVEGDSFESVTSKSTTELLAMVEQLRQALLSEEQYIHPTTEEARERHSLLAACKIELNRRGS